MFKKITYKELNARQKENYNFHKIAAVLSDYGFNSLRLTDDWEGADFIARHIDGELSLKVQLKGGLGVYKKYRGKDIYIAFRDKDDYYVYPHDAFLDEVALAKIEHTESWKRENGFYTWSTEKMGGATIPSWAKPFLDNHRL